MLELNRLQEDVAALPEESQRLILDFVSFLKQRHQTRQPESPRPLSFDDQGFVGMWSDWPETQDSTTWVRQMRQQQWQ